MDMPSGSYKQIHVQCPFYQYDDAIKKRIVCEGIMDDCNISLTFKEKKDHTIQLESFCCARYEKCELYGLIAKKYEDGY